MVRRVVPVLLFILAAASSAAQGRDKIDVCHFPASGGAQLLSVARSALPAHLAHGDVEAPPSVRTSADCLIPQPPPAPAAATAMTDAQGKVSFLIPGTNVIARIAATDASGAPVSGATAQIVVIGSDYLVTVADPELRVAPAFAEGTLAEARPGSALQLVVNVVMQAFTTYFAGGALQQPAPNFPLFVSTHFSVGEYCFTQQEYQTFIGLGCNAALLAGQAALIAVLFTDPLAGAGARAAALLKPDLCGQATQPLAAHIYAGRTLPMKTRVYSAPAIAGLQLFPFFTESLGTCGGGCCIALGTQCELASDAAKCSGRYLADTPCTPNPCKVGACCDATFGCSRVTEAECLALGRTYKGDDTLCSPNPCRIGACCNTSTGCADMPPPLCASLNGTYHGDGTSCTRSPNQQPLQYTLTSGRDLGGASVPIPFPGGRIRVTITIPSNMIRGRGTTGDCGRGDARVELRVCPFNSGCTGITWQGGHQIAICHDFTETLTWDAVNPTSGCSRFSFNAITEKPSTATVEILPP
jgi:hypothetical protein